jgi:glycosyltransferase involved in cell wall biosynthesis
MEAAAMGVPVVATNVRGCRQVVDHGETGLLVPVRNSRALSQAVARLAANPDLRERLGNHGAEKARREFDQRTVIAKTLAVYEDLLGR